MRRSNWLSRFWRSSLFFSKHFIRLMLFFAIFSQILMTILKISLTFWNWRQSRNGYCQALHFIRCWIALIFSIACDCSQNMFHHLPSLVPPLIHSIKNLLSWRAFPKIPFTILFSLYALKRFLCFFLQAVADQLNFESMTTILACSLVHVSILLRRWRIWIG